MEMPENSGAPQWWGQLVPVYRAMAGGAEAEDRCTFISVLTKRWPCLHKVNENPGSLETWRETSLFLPHLAIFSDDTF